ncbi:MAG: serine/threonine-protein kinase [Archangium sp.]
MSRVRLSEWLQRAGAATAEDATRWTIELCRVVAASPETLDVRLELISIDEDGSALALQRSPRSATPRELVTKVAAVAFELLKGMPPDGPVSSDAWIGVRPQLAQTLAAALDGSGASDVMTLAAQLSGSSGNTASYDLGKHDTLMSGGKSAPRVGREGTLLGTYELSALLGEGGMGEVYRARHVRLGREVAVKVLRPEYANDPEIVHRFFQEARVVNEINHPHIVQIVDFVESPAAVYCVMELLKGRALSTVMKEEGPLSLARIERLIGQACEALSAAHARGVVHRDIKPDNLFVTLDDTGDEQLKVLDFGIARRLTAADSAKTRAGLVMGTPSYMPPEQAAGRQVDVRADVYSLGVVVFELLTASSMAELNGAPQSVTKTALGEEVPPSLTKIVEQCLSLDAAKRPPNVEAIRAAFTQKKSPRVPIIAAAMTLIAVAAWAFWPATVVVETPPIEPPRPVPESIDAGIVEVVDAGVVEAPIVKPVVKVNATRKRMAAVKRRYDALVKKFGANQLTSIERRTVAAALEDGADAQLLGDAEAALDQAERRLDQ